MSPEPSPPAGAPGLPVEPAGPGLGGPLCILPARGGSKRIPRKNLRPFLGRPILAYAVEAALASGCFAEVMVSTEDPEIAEAARRHGAAVPFPRSAEAAGDHATTAAVLLEVLAGYRALGRAPALACCLYPTAALTTPADLREGLAALERGGFDAVLPVAPFGYPIWRSLSRAEDGRVRLNWPEHRDARSQDLPPAYHDTGQWGWFRVAALEREGSLLGLNTGSIVVDPEGVQDIDTEADWRLAEWKFERRARGWTSG